MIREFILGLDLGQASDYTALVVLERRVDLVVRSAERRPAARPETRYDVRHMERFRGEPYPAIVGRVRELMLSPALQGRRWLAVDKTGVGAPVVDTLEEKLPGGDIFPVTITAGFSPGPDGQGGFHVPKRDLASVVNVLLQNRSLGFPKSHRLTDVLVKELQNFRVKISTAGNDTYGAWREGDHDVLVLALALACWLGEHGEAQGEPDRMTREEFIRARTLVTDPQCPVDPNVSHMKHLIAEEEWKRKRQLHPFALMGEWVRRPRRQRLG